MACTPASVRPAATTPTRLPPEIVASAASSSPWTVRAPGWTWNPAKSVPSYSTRAAYRTGTLSRELVSLIALQPSDQFDLDDMSCVAIALAEIDDPSEPGGPVGVLGSDFVEELRNDERLIRELGDHCPACGQIAALGQGDHPLDSTPDLLGLGLGGLDPLVAKDRHSQILVERQSRALLAAELAAVYSVGHGSALLRWKVFELALSVDVFEVVAQRFLAVGEDEAAHAQSFLHLVERLLTEVAHPKQVVVGELQQLPDLDDVVALE